MTKIINSNALSLAAAIREIGAEPVILGIARDSRESHREKMAEGFKADVLITSAGVSAGDLDLVRDCLAELGVRQLFWKVEIKPGGPTAFGMKEGKPVFSLPGNPVSTMITFEELVRPALLRMMGHRRVIKPYVKATLRGEVRKKPGKVHFLRVRIEVENGMNWATSAGDQNTGILGTMLRANGIAVLPKEKTVFPPGKRWQCTCCAAMWACWKSREENACTTDITGTYIILEFLSPTDVTFDANIACRKKG